MNLEQYLGKEIRIVFVDGQILEGHLILKMNSMMKLQ